MKYARNSNQSKPMRFSLEQILPIQIELWHCTTNQKPMRLHIDNHVYVPVENAYASFHYIQRLGWIFTNIRSEWKFYYFELDIFKDNFLRDFPDDFLFFFSIIKSDEILQCWIGGYQSGVGRIVWSSINCVTWVFRLDWVYWNLLEALIVDFFPYHRISCIFLAKIHLVTLKNNISSRWICFETSKWTIIFIQNNLRARSTGRYK